MTWGAGVVTRGVGVVTCDVARVTVWMGVVSCGGWRVYLEVRAGHTLGQLSEERLLDLEEL